MIFNEYFRPNRFDNSLFFGGGSKSTTSSQSSTSNAVTDQRVAGSEGSVVAGSGASISIESLDAGLADSAIKEVGDIASDATAAVAASSEFVARAASDAAYSAAQSSAASSAAAAKAASDSVYSQEQTAKAAISGNTDVARDALQFGTNISEKAITAGSNLAKDALDFRSDETTAALDFAKTSQQSVNDLIRYTNEQFTSKLANNAGDAPQTTIDNALKYATLAATVLGIFLIFRNKKAA